MLDDWINKVVKANNDMNIFPNTYFNSEWKFRLNRLIKKKDKSILFDFSDTDMQVPGNFNLSFNATQSAVSYSLKALLDPEMPNNSGIFDAIDIFIPKGSF